MNEASRGIASNIVIKIIVAISVVLLIGFLSIQFGQYLSLEELAKQESRLQEFQQQRPAVFVGLAFLLYVLVTGLSLPGAAALTMVYGWYFGLLPGVLLVSFASTTGATLAFTLSRYLFRDAIEQRFGNRLETFQENLQREGAFYLFTLRLIPIVPFFVINVVMGLTPMKVWTFWWVSQIGMLAGTFLYVFAGASVPSIQDLAENGINSVFSSEQLTQIVIAMVLLGVFPFLAKKTLNWYRGRKKTSPESSRPG
ncbi:TVP38/TMEM64 family inner membrane protein YdjZ [Thalassoglobus neptunius]|uniref:TVP38/TMEM64 family membrane protein n=1 Tax=Thalassoglobus neptunius TaxID=1938619 RepID=A0A5C5WDQ8_9PLAN|nr:TVP38/TMEM64 family protein [Thalassoglobus neptunius]TWT48231.1 TVP38/TMEM64 family inner membrane protein YdjZ [Thalassoglobus neptunius]